MFIHCHASLTLDLSQGARNRRKKLYFPSKVQLSHSLRGCMNFLKALQVCNSLSEKIRMDVLRALVPPIVEICNLRRTNNCASFGLINIISTQILGGK